MGKDQRKSFFLKMPNYHNPDTKYIINSNSMSHLGKSGPRFSFGSSNREKNYLGLSKFKLANNPGPGSYKIPVHVAKRAYYESAKKDPRYSYI